MILEIIRNLKPRPSSPFTRHEVETIEALIQGHLPSTYRQMLATYGGCSFQVATYYNDPIHNCPVMFGWFFDFEELRDAILSQSENLPPTTIPVGDDGGGNIYCLGVRDGDADKIYFHDHNRGWDDEAQSLLSRQLPLPLRLRYQTAYLLADSFLNFIASFNADE